MSRECNNSGDQMRNESLNYQVDHSKITTKTKQDAHNLAQKVRAEQSNNPINRNNPRVVDVPDQGLGAYAQGILPTSEFHWNYPVRYIIDGEVACDSVPLRKANLLKMGMLVWAENGELFVSDNLTPQSTIQADPPSQDEGEVVGEPEIPLDEDPESNDTGEIVGEPETPVDEDPESNDEGNIAAPVTPIETDTPNVETTEDAPEELNPRMDSDYYDYASMVLEKRALIMSPSQKKEYKAKEASLKTSLIERGFELPVVYQDQVDENSEYKTRNELANELFGETIERAKDGLLAAVPENIEFFKEFIQDPTGPGFVDSQQHPVIFKKQIFTKLGGTGFVTLKGFEPGSVTKDDTTPAAVVANLNYRSKNNMRDILNKWVKSESGLRSIRIAIENNE